MVEVRVLIDNFKDKKNFTKGVEVKRNNEVIFLKGKLLQKGDIYSITQERYEELSKLKIVEKVKKDKNPVNTEGA